MASLHSKTIGKNEAPPLLLLHGWGHSLKMMEGLGELLSHSHYVHLLDLPGHGKSDKPDGVWGVKEFADAVLAYLDEHSIQHVSLIGHSFGGKTSLKFASLYPERVEKVVLINSSGLPAVHSLKKRVRNLWLSLLRSTCKYTDRVLGTKLFIGYFVPRYASADYLSAGDMKNTFVKIVNEHFDEILPTLKHKFLLLWGERDTETPVQSGKRMSVLLPNATLKLLQGAGHVPFVGAGAHVCAYHIEQFLREEDR